MREEYSTPIVDSLDDDEIFVTSACDIKSDLHYDGVIKKGSLLIYSQKDRTARVQDTRPAGKGYLCNYWVVFDVEPGHIKEIEWNIIKPSSPVKWKSVK